MSGSVADYPLNQLRRGYRWVPQGDDPHTYEHLPEKDFRKCRGCDRDFHMSWGRYCPDCTGAS